MTRWRLTIEYDGGPFMGWQRQEHGPSVQQTLEEAIHRMTSELATFTAAGRTDAGVTVHSASGDVEIGDAGGGPIKVRTASGDVRIGVRQGRRVAVDVRTVSGEAVSDIPLDGAGKEDADAPLVDIQVNGVSGDVRIERAAESAPLEV